jgi:5-formyltetrahydrofolate cyclo-ligase
MTKSKDILRQEALRHRNMIIPQEMDAEQACSFFFEAVKPQAGQVVAAYWPMRREFSTFEILQRLHEEKIACALPVVQKNDKCLKFARWHDGDALEEGIHGTQQPIKKEFLSPDMIIVPLLAFDRRGYRLGYGGGYYDATISALKNKKDIVTVGLAYATQACLFNLPIEEHDVKLDYVVTPQGVQRFT